MKVIKLVVVSVLITSFFGAALLNSAKNDNKAAEEVGGKNYVKDMNKPLEAIYKDDLGKLDRLYNCSIWSGRTIGRFPHDINLQIKPVSFEDFKRMTGNQLKDKSLKLYDVIIHKMADVSLRDNTTPHAVLKHYLSIISPDYGKRHKYYLDPLAYENSQIASAKEFLESRHFTLHEYRMLIEKIMKEYGNDVNGGEASLIRNKVVEDIK